jgi:hypothetical protein
VRDEKGNGGKGESRVSKWRSFTPGFFFWHLYCIGFGRGVHLHSSNLRDFAGLARRKGCIFIKGCGMSFKSQAQTSIEVSDYYSMRYWIIL